jgi:hypothetical protein
MDNSKEIDLSGFKKPGEGDCLSMCKKVPIRDERGFKIICLSCKRIIMEKTN